MNLQIGQLAISNVGWMLKNQHYQQFTSQGFFEIQQYKVVGIWVRT